MRQPSDVWGDAAARVYIIRNGRHIKQIYKWQAGTGKFAKIH